MSAPPRRIGRYELVAELGRGGAGQVWEALLIGPRGFRKPVALKVLHAHVDQDSPQYQSLIHEARLGALLSHPNVVSIYELAQTDDGQLFVAMELVHGPTVLDLIRDRPLDPASVLDVGMQSAEALQHVHALKVDGTRSGLVHRDVKPSNLLVDTSGLVKLTDLGVARLTTSNEAQAYIAGTPGYMSPEQMQGKEDHRTDLFSLGATLYVLAAGKRPFGSGTPALRRTVQVERALSDPAFLRAVEEKVEGLGEIVGRCLRFDPEKRFDSASDLCDALRMLRAQHPGPGLRAVASRVPTPSFSELEAEPMVTDIPTAERPVPSLPEANDRFVGRAAVLRRLKREVTEGGLVALTGPAGCGKSRLALELARRMEQQGQAAWFVPLGDVVDATEWMSRFAAAINVPLGDGDHGSRLGHSLRALGHALVVLDDADGVVQSVADTAATWRSIAPRVRLVLTSRRVPKGEGLRQVALTGLPLEEAADLFYARAPQPPPATARAEVVELVRRVDGLPLAVELLAARTRHVGLDQIAARMDYRLFSTSSQAGGPSLGAALEASLEHLSPAERSALGQLSVCVEGFTLEAADGLIDLRADDVPWALDLVERLAQESLVSIDPDTGRVRMLHTVRAYAHDALDVTERQAAERRHAAYFAQLGSVAAVDALHRTGGLERLQALAAERGNLAAALGRSLAMRDWERAEGCAIALWEVLQVLGPLSTAWEVLHRVVETLGDAASARLLAAAGQSATLHAGRGDAEPLLLRAIERARATGDGISRANAEGCLGYLHRDAGNPDQAQRYLEASLLGHKMEGNRGGEGMALYRLALLRYHQSQLVEARGLTEGAVRAFREVGDRRQEGVAIHTYALMLSELGQHDEALRRGDVALAIHREQHNRHAEAVALGNQGIMLRRLGRLDEALRYYEIALQANRAIGNRRLEGAILGNLGTLHVALEDFEKARGYYEQAIEAHREVGNRHYEGIVLGNYGELLHKMGEDREARVRLGIAIGIGEAVKDISMQGSFLAVLGQVLEALGDPDGADASFDEAERVLESVKDPTARARAFLYRAETLIDRGDTEGALAAVARADVISTGVSDASEVRLKVRSLRARARG